MCNASALTKTKKRIEEVLDKTFEIPLEYQPYYHLNGFSHGNLQIIKMDEKEKIYPAMWGLIPAYGLNNIPEFQKKYNTLNARSESIFKSNTFKHSLLEKRCLILADGFFEPHHINGKPTPYFCYQPSDEEGDDGRKLFLFAGLYAEIDDDSYSCTILTTEANDFFAEVHNKKKRMPLVLDSELYTDWLSDSHNEKTLKDLLNDGFTRTKFDAYPVSNMIYQKNIDANVAKAIQPVEKTTLF
ncbi:SOS response-associated peptidase [Leeuwenhoekiella sp. W20_SRS_FM14]|uniref:SOS response-associated peptidase n=1 Tax=Leeuwenhoekiella sp. W20_SRS_FM14 TaxID=3240270 RepID=UPI003F978CF4